MAGAAVRSAGSRARAVGATVGATTAVGAIGTGAAVPIGNTVTWMIDNVGLKNMVIVAAAFLMTGFSGLI